MAKIVAETEASRFDDLSSKEWYERAASAGKAVGVAARLLASTPGLKGVVVTTMTGASARDITRFRPEFRLAACTPDERLVRQLALLWGATPLHLKKERSMERLSMRARAAVLRAKLFKKGDEVVLVTGSPVGKPGTTNRVEVVKL